MEVRIGFIGNVDSGKSSSISVLVHKELDDGRGAARSRVFRFPHELKSGRTSSIGAHYLHNGDDVLILYDLAGHEKYLKTTIKGLSGYYIDYAVVVIGANEGKVSKMTKEHLGLAAAMRIPIIIILTKTDMANEEITKKTIESIRKTLKSLPQKMLFEVKDDFETVVNLCKDGIRKIAPFFRISNKTGDGIDIFRKFLMSLRSHYVWNDMTSAVFRRFDTYHVKGIGCVMSGIVSDGVIKVGDKLKIGPYNGWNDIVVKSIHNNFRENIVELRAGHSGCLAIRLSSTRKMRSGIVICKEPVITNDFDADVYIFNTQTTIKKGYSPVVNCRTTVQSAEIKDIYDNDVLRCGSRSRVRFSFSHRPEMIGVGDMIIFREGTTRGVGKILRTNFE